MTRLYFTELCTL